MSFSISVLTEIFHQLYTFMLDTELFGISLFVYWLGMILVSVSVSMLLIITQAKHGG